MTADYHLKEKCGPDVSGFYAVLFAPRAKRESLRAVHVLGRELREVVEAHLEPAITQAKIEWWRAEVERTIGGSPRHPVMQALATPIASGQLAAADLHAAIGVAETLVTPPPIESLDEFEAHCHRTAGSLMRLCAGLLDLDVSASEQLVASLTTATELTRLITTLGADIQRNRQFIPREVSSQFALATADWHGPGTSAPLRAMLEHLATEAHERYQRAPAALSAADRIRARPLLIHAAIERARLAQVASDGFPVLREQLLLPPLRMLAIALRARLSPAQSRR